MIYIVGKILEMGAKIVHKINLYNGYKILYEV